MVNSDSGSSMQVVAYTLQAAALPFPVFVLAGVINGAGLAIQVACLLLSQRVSHSQSNSCRTHRQMDMSPALQRTAKPKWGTFKLHMVGFLRFLSLVIVFISSIHLGAGALVAPLVSTQFAQLRRWSFHYLVSLGITALNTVFLAVVFRARRQDGASRPP